MNKEPLGFVNNVIIISNYQIVKFVQIIVIALNVKIQQYTKNIFLFMKFIEKY